MRTCKNCKSRLGKCNGPTNMWTEDACSKIQKIADMIESHKKQIANLATDEDGVIEELQKIAHTGAIRALEIEKVEQERLFRLHGGIEEEENLLAQLFMGENNDQ